MKVLALLVCLLVYVGCSEAHVYEPCPAGWMSFGSSCYRYYGQVTNQITAENICRQFSGCSGGIGHLVSLNTAAEDTFIFNYIKGLTGTNIPPQSWLGARRMPGSSRWMWSDGTEITYSTYNGFPGQSNPSDQGRNCMSYSPESPQPQWLHINCAAQSLPFMCELQANIPDPVTCPTAGNNPTGQNPMSPLRALPYRYNKKGNMEQRHSGSVKNPIQNPMSPPRELPYRYNMKGNIEQRHSGRA
ncbi:echinoidin-like [Patiria miniata]|uniref:C-type lectin domain-containing protein n=1 Tax=Patiria miniata TaxID=46514 RepID=A0A913Z617_PATMI|nr:echinoidin-like [Patiria miniata]